MKPLDMTGQKFNSLTVLSREPSAKDGSAKWLCLCDCGNLFVAIGKNIRNNHTQSCGCLQRKRSSEASTTHGKTRTGLHNVWKTMKQRCTNPNNHKFHLYGARGIRVCDEWMNSFEAFYDYVSQLPHFGEKGRSIDRIDVNGNYEPGNVRWATASEQEHNKRRKVTKCKP
jgi:hypothetical protein